MKESLLKKTVILLCLSTIISMLWAIGANSRKKVELKTSKILYEKLEKLTRANTVIIDDLKNASNKLGTLEQSKQQLKEILDKAQESNQELQEKLQSAQSGQKDVTKEIADLKSQIKLLETTNTTLGEELIKLKKRDIVQQQEIIELTRQLESQGLTRINKKQRKTAVESENNNSSANKKFNWQ
ncbi:MAG: hypothetical protein ABIG64_08080 [Candidatus Omnitrophota bacterium]